MVECPRHPVEIMRDAIDCYGSDNQLIVACEELSELQKEICKALRGNPSFSAIAEEIADVEIMVEQLKMIFANGCDVAVFKQAKLERLEKRMSKEE